MSSAPLSTPDGLGSASGAPNLPAGSTDTFARRYIDTGELRLHAVVGGGGPPVVLVHGWPETWYYVRMLSNPDSLRGSFGWYRALDTTIAQNEQRKTTRLAMPVLAIGGEASYAEHVGEAMEFVADDVQSVVIAGTGHWVAENAPDEMLGALTAFLAPYRDRQAAAHTPGTVASA